jgi:hypothetical protein
VLNIPVRKDGVTIGSLNLLHGAGHYDKADEKLARVFAQLAVCPFETAGQNLRSGSHDTGDTERV